MNQPILYHDPSSEPSRAVHWLAAEAGLEMGIEYTWLTRGAQRAPGFLEINPAHQVPALDHGGFRLAEAAAIMLYLVDINGLQEYWVGATPEGRARTHRFLSWHHSNTRRITLDFFLPALLMPAYHGKPVPAPEAIEGARTRGRESLELLETVLSRAGPYLVGGRPRLADLFIASDLFALDLDPQRGAWFEGLDAVSAWLERLRETGGYRVSHRPWNAVLPRLQALLADDSDTPRDCRWVADALLAAT